MDHTPHIVLINLDRDSVRLEHMTRQFEALGLSFSRFSAVDGEHVPDALIPYFNLEDGGDFFRLLSPGEIGCYASHLAICRDIVDGRLPSPLLVFEDDVALCRDFIQTLDSLTRALPREWDIVRLSNDTKRAFWPVAQVWNGSHLARYSKVPPSTGAYLISRSGAEKFLARAKRNLPIDQDLRRVWAWDLDTYGVLPAPVQRDILQTSTIDSMTQEGWRTAKRRVASMRFQRFLETVPRHIHGVRTFGLERWIRAETINLFVGSVDKSRRQRHLVEASHALGRHDVIETHAKPVPASVAT